MTAWQWLRRHPALHLWLPPAAWMGGIFALSAQSRLPHPKIGWADLLLSSGGHALVFAVLAVLWLRALGRRPHAWRWALLLTTLYALSDEWHQSFVPGRHPDPWDLLCDGVGAAAGLWVWTRIQPPAGCKSWRGTIKISPKSRSW